MKVSCEYKEDDLENCLNCKRSSHACTGPMTAEERRAAGVRNYKSIRVKKEVASFVKEILEPLLDSGVSLPEVTALLAGNWDVPTNTGTHE
jgi:hypothetical protein